ncbi:MAG: hypothetical protein QM796_17930 [Chthoniobacteraceae bacterium]
MSLPPEVLIVAEGDWYGVCRLPKLFHRAGVKVTLMVLPRALARRTRYATSLPTDGCYGVRDLIARLRQHLAENPGRYQWIIPGDDMTMRACEEETDKAWLRDWFPVEPTTEKMKLATSKAAIVEACRRAGLPTPHSIPCRNLEEGLQAAREIGYPVFFKGEESSSGFGVGWANGEADLRQLAQKMGEHYLQNFSIQEAIKGQVGSTLVMAWHGEPIQWSGSYKSATWPGPYGASSQRILIRHPDVDRMACKITQLTGFHGFFSIDWIQAKRSGRCHVIEMNPRPTPELQLSPRTGVDFSLGIRHLLCGGPKPNPIPATAPPGRWRMFPQELYRCQQEHDFKGLATWLVDLLRGRSDIPWDDRSLLVGLLKKFGRHYLHTQQAAKRTA